MIRRIWQFPFFDINIIFIDIGKLIMGKNRKKQGKPQRIRLFHQNLCEAHGKSYKKSVICTITFDRRQRYVIDSRRHTPAVYPPPCANHWISANTNPQPIRQLTLDTQKSTPQG